jgi:hypothetical protein
MSASRRCSIAWSASVSLWSTVWRHRDRREGWLGDLDFTVIDTAGLEEAAASLTGRMQAQTDAASRGRRDFFHRRARGDAVDHAWKSCAGPASPQS